MSRALELALLGGVVENGIINGDFGYWQRGTGFLGQGYTADRWMLNVSGAAGPRVDRLTLAPGAWPTEARFALQLTAAGQAAAGDYVNVQHRFEGVRKYAGKRIRVAFLAQRISGAGDVVVEAEQVFGTGGSPSATVNGVLPAQSQRRITPTATPTRFSVAIDIPSITGKLVGTTGDDFLDLTFWISAGANWNARADSLGLQTQVIAITDVQTVEVVPGFGDPVLPFLRRSRQQELALCQRFYEKSYDVDTVPATATFNGMVTTHASNGYFLQQGSHRFSVSKRVPIVPSIYGVYDGNPNSVSEYNIGSQIVSSRTANIFGPGQCQFAVGGDGNMTPGNQIRFHWVANAEL